MSEEHVASLFSFELCGGRNWLDYIGGLQGMLSVGTTGRGKKMDPHLGPRAEL